MGRRSGWALLVLALQAFVPPLGSFAFASGPKPEPRGRGAAALTAGLEAIRRVELSVAVTRLEQAISAELSEASGIDFERVREARLQLAATRLRKGEEDLARRVLVEALRWDPDFTPSGDAFPPVFFRELDRARASLDRTGRVRVTSPDAAAVRLDGRPVGAVPLMLRELPRGRHVIEVDLGGGEVFAQFVDLEENEVFIDATANPLTLSSSTREEASAGRADASIPSPTRADAPIAEPKRAELVPQTSRPVFKSSRRRKAEELATTKRDPRLQERRTEWWVWVLGGVGVAALAGGTYWGISQATRPVSGTVSTTW